MSFDPSNLSDYELTENIKKNTECNSSLIELVHRHTGVFLKVANRFRGIGEQDFADIVESKPWTIYAAALKFDKSRAEFQTLVGKETEYLCLDILENKKKYHFEEIKPEYYSNSSVIREVENHEDMENLQSVLEKNSVKSKEIFNERYMNTDNINLPGEYKKIGEKYQNTGWAIKLREKEIVKKIKNKLKRD